MKAFVLLLLAGVAFADDPAALAPRVTDYPTKFKLIAMGADALAPLMAQVEAKEPRLAFESRSAVRWIVNQAPQRDAMVRRLAPFAGAAQPPATRIFAAELLGSLRAPAAVPVLRAMIGEIEPVAQAAVAALARTPGDEATEALIEARDGTSAAVQDEIWRALGDRRVRLALPLLMEAAKAGDEAAIDGLGRAGYADAEMVLVGALEKDVAGAFDALLRISEHSRNGPMLARTFYRARSEAERLGVIRAAARVGAMHARVIVILEHASSEEELGLPARHALLTIADRAPVEKAAPICRAILANAKDPALAARALAAVARCRDTESVPLVVRHLDGPLRRTAIGVLRDIPGAAALDALLGAKPDAALFDALGDRGDLAAAPLLEKQLSEEAAARAYLKLAAKAPAARARAMYLAVLPRPAALRGLARVGTEAELPQLYERLEQRDALAAVVAIAGRLAAAGQSDAAVGAYQRALAKSAPVENRLRLLGQRVEYAARDGRIRAWWVTGPFPAKTIDDWGKAEFPEKGFDLASGKWRPVEGAGDDAIVDLDGLFTPNDRTTAYAFAEIHVESAGNAILKVGSDDGIACWVNGAEVHRNHAMRGVTPDEDEVTITLAKGRNLLLIKVMEGAGGWGFCARLVDEQGRPLPVRIR